MDISKYLLSPNKFEISKFTCILTFKIQQSIKNLDKSHFATLFTISYILICRHGTSCMHVYIYVLKSLFPNFYLFNSKEKLSDNVIDWSFFLDKSYTKMVLNFWEIIFLKVNFKKLKIINVVLFNFR